MELTQAQLEIITKGAAALDMAFRRYLRYEEEIELTGATGDNTKEWARVGTNRLLVITHMSAYDVNNACTYIRLGFWNRTRHVWHRIVPAPLVLETVEFNGEMVLQEGMWPVVQWNGVTDGDDLYALVEGYWVRAPRIS